MRMVSCAIALGSNLGDSQSILQDALAALNATEGIAVLTHSSVYQTAPVGPPQPDYLNCAALLQTCLAPEVLLRELLQVEASFGRVRRERWGPRLLDLDLILFGDLVLTTPTLQIPHPRMHERAFVLVPLSEIAPDWIEPISGKTIAQLVEQVDHSGVHLLKVKES
ncbi:MAG: 2-amino-4-hydroxy-6-hydroxymethyldihydropteridine diphosphokinase [Cyanobacteria bacterium Co-bin13]|nr:2-amino-4-hydroxy-6-hydroxymethyldihydropteridine diphosphokinase [Cyanobacteria bacterium Co-bin13]